MSYSVIHMTKLKMGAMKGIENHNERLKESLTNPDIVDDRSHLNYDLHTDHDKRTYYMRVKDRIKELDLKKAVRKDAVVAVGFITTSDKNYFDQLSDEQSKKYFQVSYNFLKERYGAENIISSKVHLDERTPHMHTYIVPVTSDGRLSAKSIFTKVELKSLQSEYNAHMRANGFDLEKGESTRSHIELAEFKKQTAYKEIEEAELKKNTLKNDLNALENDLKRFEGVMSRLNTFVAVEGKKTLLSPNKVTVDVSDLENLNQMAKTLALYKNKFDRVDVLENQVSELQLKVREYLNRAKEAENENIKLNTQISKITKKITQDKDFEYSEQINQVKNALRNAYSIIDLSKEAILNNDLQEALKYLNLADIEKEILENKLDDQEAEMSLSDWENEY